MSSSCSSVIKLLMGGGRRGTCTHGEVGGTSRDVGGVGKHTGRWEGQACILGMGGAVSIQGCGRDK